jgi:hypothetical protein
MEAPTLNAGQPVGENDTKKPAGLLRVPTDKPEHVSLNKRRSLRVRPTEHLDKDVSAPRAPLRENSRPKELQPKSSKMSLFNLFSKPKVEKLRGHSEQALSTSRSNFDLRAAKQPAVITSREIEPEVTRTLSVAPKALSKKASRMTLREPPSALASKELKPGVGDPLPLFQAWPQAIKHAVLEVSSITSDLLSQQSKNRQSTALQLSNFDAPSRSGTEEITALEALTTANGTSSSAKAKSSSKHMSKSSLSTMDLPRKLFILSTTGCIIQYSEKGSSDRPPERILQLGKESAAFACDLIPGRLHVLEVLQCVNEKGGSAAGSGSLLKKIGIRSSAARRQASNFLLVMDDAAALASWMSAVRKQIEVQGGKRARPDSVTRRPKTANAETADLDLKKVPSNSHRYQVRRDPSRVSSIISPTLDQADKKFFESPLASPIQIITESDQLETGPVELSADGEIKARDDASTHLRGNSDAGSLESSDSNSVDQHHLDKLRESTTTANTSSTSRTSSLTSSPLVEQRLITAREGVQESGPAKLPYRSSSSYSLSKRRSALPSPRDLTASPDMKGPAPLLLQQQINIEAPIDSPVLGNHPLVSDASPRKLLSAMQSAPDLKSVAEVGEMHDFGQTAAAPSTSPAGSRPISFVAELPTSPLWTQKSSPNLRSSMASAKVALDGVNVSPQQQSSPKRTSMGDPELPRLGKASAHSFSLPLRITTSEMTSPRSSTRPARSDSEGDLVSPIAVVHTLTAKVDPAQQKTISPLHIPPRTSSNFSPPISTLNFESNLIRHSNSTRLSLFPSALPSPPMSADRLHRSPSTSALLTLGAFPTPTAHTPTTPSLRRPTSMQIRSNHAPFLANVRSPPQQTPNQPPASATRSGMPVPIRGLRPSRSGIPTYSPANHSTASDGSRRESLLATPLPLPPSQPRTSISSPNLLLLAKEAADQRMSLVQQQAISAASWDTSPPSAKKISRPLSRAVLPELDFGVPLIGLGPPAPPPSAPLPQIPSMANRPRVPGSAPVGVSNASPKASPTTPTTPPRLPLAGLGIEVSGS